MWGHTGERGTGAWARIPFPVRCGVASARVVCVRKPVRGAAVGVEERRASVGEGVLCLFTYSSPLLFHLGSAFFFFLSLFLSCCPLIGLCCLFVCFLDIFYFLKFLLCLPATFLMFTRLRAPLPSFSASSFFLFPVFPLSASYGFILVIYALFPPLDPRFFSHPSLRCPRNP